MDINGFFMDKLFYLHFCFISPGLSGISVLLVARWHCLLNELLPCGHLTHIGLLGMFSRVLKDSSSRACPILAAGARYLVSTSGGAQGWQRHPLLLGVE